MEKRNNALVNFINKNGGLFNWERNDISFKRHDEINLILTTVFTGDWNKEDNIDPFVDFIYDVTSKAEISAMYNEVDIDDVDLMSDLWFIINDLYIEFRKSVEDCVKTVDGLYIKVAHAIPDGFDAFEASKSMTNKATRLSINCEKILDFVTDDGDLDHDKCLSWSKDQVIVYSDTHDEIVRIYNSACSESLVEVINGFTDEGHVISLGFMTNHDYIMKVFKKMLDEHTK